MLLHSNQRNTKFLRWDKRSTPPHAHQQQLATCENARACSKYSISIIIIIIIIIVVVVSGCVCTIRSDRATPARIISGCIFLYYFCLCQVVWIRRRRRRWDEWDKCTIVVFHIIAYTLRIYFYLQSHITIINHNKFERNSNTQYQQN